MEEEISLRDLIEIMITGKWVILGVALFAVLVAAVITYIPRGPSSYRSEVVMSIDPQSPFEVRPPVSRDLAELSQALRDAEVHHADKLGAIIKSHAFVAEVHSHLRLAERGMAVNDVARALVTTVDTTKTTVTIGFAHTDPVLVKEVVETLPLRLQEHLVTRQRGRLNLLAGNVERLLSIDLATMRRALHGLELARDAHKPLLTYQDTSHLNPEFEVLSQEIARLISQILQLEAKLVGITEFRAAAETWLIDANTWTAHVPGADVVPVRSGLGALSLGVAAVLGLMLGTMGVFFVNYWKSTDPRVAAK